MQQLVLQSVTTQQIDRACVQTKGSQARSMAVGRAGAERVRSAFLTGTEARTGRPALTSAPWCSSHALTVIAMCLQACRHEQLPLAPVCSGRLPRGDSGRCASAQTRWLRLPISCTLSCKTPFRAGQQEGRPASHSAQAGQRQRLPVWLLHPRLCGGHVCAHAGHQWQANRGRPGR